MRRKSVHGYLVLFLIIARLAPAGSCLSAVSCTQQQAVNVYSKLPVTEEGPADFSAIGKHDVLWYSPKKDWCDLGSCWIIFKIRVIFNASIATNTCARVPVGLTRKGWPRFRKPLFKVPIGCSTYLSHGSACSRFRYPCAWHWLCFSGLSHRCTVGLGWNLDQMTVNHVPCFVTWQVRTSVLFPHQKNQSKSST